MGPASTSAITPPARVRRGKGRAEARKEGKGDGDKDRDKRAAFLKAMKKMTPWKMKDLSIPSYVKLARKLVAEKKLWSQFLRLFVSTLVNRDSAVLIRFRFVSQIPNKHMYTMFPPSDTSTRSERQVQRLPRDACCAHTVDLAQSASSSLLVRNDEGARD